jgi:serine/threonine protein kinase
MESVDGCTAAELIADRCPSGMPFELVAKIVSAAGGALDSAHRQGLPRGNLTPTSIVVVPSDDGGDQRILLADCAIVHTSNDGRGPTDAPTTVDEVAYVAPERLMGYEIDARADQYSLAATAYHLLTASQLYLEANPATVVSRHLHAAPPKLADVRQDVAGLDSSWLPHCPSTRRGGSRPARISRARSPRETSPTSLPAL